MSNAVSSLIFAYRNVGKTQNGEIGRAPVAAAQGINVLSEVARYNKAIAKGTEAATSMFSNLAKHNKAVDYAVKGVNWATKNVNPLICVSGGIKVLTSDDKVSSAIKETSALATMFAGERLAKEILPKIIKSQGKGGALLKGILFVCASIGSYSAGEYFGKNLSKEVKASWDFGKINQMA